QEADRGEERHVVAGNARVGTAALGACPERSRRVQASAARRGFVSFIRAFNAHPEPSCGASLRPDGRGRPSLRGTIPTPCVSIRSFAGVVGLACTLYSSPFRALSPFP